MAFLQRFDFHLQRNKCVCFTQFNGGFFTKVVKFNNSGRKSNTQQSLI